MTFGSEISLNIPRQAARRTIGLEKMPAQAVREPDEIQTRVPGRVAGSVARFAELIQDIARLDERFEAGGKARRRDDRIEWFARTESPARPKSGFGTPNGSST